MNTICLNAVQYVIEFIKLFLVTDVFFGVRQKKRVYPMFGLSLLVVMIVSLFYDISKEPVIYGIIASLVLIFNMGGKKKKKAGLIVLSYIGIGVIDMILAVVCIAIFRLDMDRIDNSIWVGIGINSISLILFLFVWLLLYIKKIRFTTIQIKKYLPIYLLAGFALSLYLTSAQLMGMGERVLSYRYILMFGLTLSSLVMVILCALLLVNSTKNAHLEREAEIQANLLKTQKEYYTMLLLKENATKAFRHDIKHHVYCLRKLCQEDKYEELKAYLQDLDGEVDKFLPKVDTGNQLITALVNNIFSKFPDVNLEWRGKLPNEVRISSIDLCTIFSNLLTNAFEATCKCEIKQVEVKVKFLESTLMIVITNHIDHSPKKHKGEFISDKTGEGHGFGLQNVKRCVEKNNGSYSVLEEKNTFTTKVILPGALKF